MKKLLSILGAVGLTATGATVAVSCSGDKAGNKAIALDTVITKKEVTVAKGQKENKQAILDAVKAANTNLQTDKVEVKIAENKTVTIETTDKKVYTGSVTITVTEKDDSQAIALDTVITKKEVTVAKDQKENKQAILDAVKAANTNLQTDKVEVKIAAGVVTIETTDTTVYTGSVTITVSESE